MQSPNEFLVNVFSLVKKAFHFEDGALAIIALPIALSFKKIFSVLIQNVELKSLFLPFMVFGVLISVYSVVSAVDFITGLRASKKEAIKKKGTAKGYIESAKLWSSIWKFLGVILIGTILTIFKVIFVIGGLETLNEVFRVITIFFFIVVISFDLHSIGENQLRSYGSKPAFYTFIDEVSKTVRTGIIDKIKRYFE